MCFSLKHAHFSTLTFRTRQEGRLDQRQCPLKKLRFHFPDNCVYTHCGLVAGAEEEGAHGVRAAGGGRPGAQLPHLSREHCTWRTGSKPTQSCENGKVVEPGCAASLLHLGHAHCFENWLSRYRDWDWVSFGAVSLQTHHCIALSSV